MSGADGVGSPVELAHATARRRTLAIGALIAVAILWMLRGGRNPMPTKLWQWSMAALPFLPLFAISFGWIMAEMGRQPWIVAGVLPTMSAVSPSVSFGEAVLTMVLFTLIYGAGITLLFIHISHGFWSLLQTFGISHPRYDYPLRVITWALAGIMGGVFLLITLLMVISRSQLL